MNVTDPVAHLAALGRPKHSDAVDYLDFGFTEAHIPALLAMLDQPSFFMETAPPDEDPPGWYATIHAWRILGLLQAKEAMPALIGQIRMCEENDIDWGMEEIPHAFAAIGPAAISELDATLVEEADGNEWVLAALAACLEAIGVAHPATRDEVVVLLRRELNLHRELYDLNGLIIGHLLTLHAVEAIDDIRAAHDAGLVDETISGDIEDVEIELGLRRERENPRPPSLLNQLEARFRKASASHREFYADAERQKRTKKAKRKKQKQAKKRTKRGKR